MAAGAVLLQGPFVEYPGSIEIFSELETNDTNPAVPATSNPVNVPLVAFTGADMIREWELFFDFLGTYNAYTGTVTTSPWFPYNYVQTLEVPYQSSSFKLQSMDGHLTFLQNLLRPVNRRGSYAEPYMDGQAAALSTGYSVQANAVSAANYAPAASTQKRFRFPLRVDAARYFERFYDVQADGKMIMFQDAYVSPLLMSSTGRNIVPKIVLNPVVGATLDIAPFTSVGGTTLTWTDNGSVVYVRRNGWRQPINAADMPPIFNWALQWYLMRVPISNAKPAFQLPADGQVLSVIGRMFDPTLAAGVGGAIPLANLVSLKLTYGSGINKFFDTPRSIQNRILRQHGWLPTEGVFIWDLYQDTRSNLDAINTLTTAAPTVSLDFTGNTPGAGSYVDVLVEYLTLIGS